MAGIANRFLRTGCFSAFMNTIISTYRAVSIIPYMIFYISYLSTTTVIFFLMSFFCLYPYLISTVVCHIFICILLATCFANRTFCTCCFSSAVYAYITTCFTSTVFPVMIFLCYRHFTTAIIFLFMCCCCLCPLFCSCMIVCIYFSIFTMAGIANRFLRAGCFSAFMNTIISTYRAVSILPDMICYISYLCTTTVIFFLMSFFCLYPHLFSTVVCRI